MTFSGKLTYLSIFYFSMTT